MNDRDISKEAAIDVYRLQGGEVYSIETASAYTGIPRRRIALYCRHRLISPLADPDQAGWWFDDEAIRKLQQVEKLHVGCGLNLQVLELVLRLRREIEELQRELRFLRGM